MSYILINIQPNANSNIERPLSSSIVNVKPNSNGIGINHHPAETQATT